MATVSSALTFWRLQSSKKASPADLIPGSILESSPRTPRAKWMPESSPGMTQERAGRE